MITHMDRLRRLFGQAVAVDWDEVFTAELPRIFNYFRFHGVEDSVAEDLSASTFEKAWRARQSYRSEKSAVSTWLFTIARHNMVDYFRAVPVEQPLAILENRPEMRIELLPEEAFQNSEDRERLRRSLLRLPERERELVALKYGAEMTNRAIAKQTGLSESNVGTILNRVVVALRTQMEEEQ
jgi:RNA polymerase sigma-70 factor (ECF subfamily)